MAVALLKCDFANGAGKMHLFETQTHSADSPGATTLLSVKQVHRIGYDTSDLTPKRRLHQLYFYHTGVLLTICMSWKCKDCNMVPMVTYGCNGYYMVLH
jgi:hypothetical protein